MLENNQPQPPILLKDLGMIYPNEKSKRPARYGLYKCQCGAEFRAPTAKVKSGHTNSCGCYNRQQTTTHGLTGHPLYSIWSSIITRTSNPTNTSFKNYGARGIKMCDEWVNSPQAFFDWCYENGYEKGLQIDRINNDGNYEPLNCRWTTCEAAISYDNYIIEHGLEHTKNGVLL